MKKVLLIVALSLVVALTGCGAGETQVSTSPSDASAPADAIVVTDDGLGTKNTMLLGLYHLQKSDQPLTAEQAAELATLWQAYKSVTASGTSSTEETEALLSQMQAALTGVQIAAINAMGLDNDSLLAFYSEVGIEMPTPAPGETPRVPGSGAGQDLTEEEKAARREASGEEEGGSSRATIVIDKVIEVLQAAS